jgi:hypothetical protein
MVRIMHQTIQVSSRVSVRGDFVEWLPNGDALVRDGLRFYRGRPIAPFPITERPCLRVVPLEPA